MASTMASAAAGDEQKTAADGRVIRSDPHIFDNKLYDEWKDAEAEAAVDGKHAQADDSNSASLDLEVTESKTFSIEYENGIFCMKYSPDGQYLAVGCADGGVRILRSEDGKLAHRLKTSGSMPVTSMAWKPSLSNVGSSSCLMTTSSSGCLDIWHVQSSKCIYSIHEEGNQIFACDVSPASGGGGGGFRFASAGKDKTIRVYDDETKKLVCSLQSGWMAKHVGHSNRIFALKWKPDDANVVLSGGWDSCVLMWDLRSASCFRSIFGPHIAGQTVDIQNDIVATGSWRIRDTIGLYDFSTGKPLEQRKVEWQPSPMIYSLAYSGSLEGVVAAGGTGINTMKVINTGIGQKSASFALANKAGIYCLDWEPKGHTLAFAGHSSDISVLSLKF